ncbi:MAG: hypothetical protein ACK40Z_05155 [Dietzia sp.]
MASEPDGRAAVDTWEELNTHTVKAALRWNKRIVERREEYVDAGDQQAQIAFRVQALEQAIDSAAMIQIETAEGSVTLDLGMQFHLDRQVKCDDSVLAEYGRHVAAPMLISYLRGALTSECQTMGWQNMILPPTVEDSLRRMSDERILGQSEA